MKIRPEEEDKEKKTIKSERIRDPIDAHTKQQLDFHKIFGVCDNFDRAVYARLGFGAVLIKISTGLL